MKVKKNNQKFVRFIISINNSKGLKKQDGKEKQSKICLVSIAINNSKSPSLLGLVKT